MSTAEGGNALSDSGEELSSCKGGRPEGIVGQRDNLATASQGLVKRGEGGGVLPKFASSGFIGPAPGFTGSKQCCTGVGLDWRTNYNIEEKKTPA